MSKINLRKILTMNEILSLALVIVLSIGFGIANPVFFSVNNIFSLLRMCVLPGIFACGVMLVLISGGVDLSFTWIGMFGAYTTSKVLSALQLNTGFIMPLPIVFLMSMLIGAVLGSFNALLVSKFKIPIFVATISSANIFMGLMFQFVGSVYIFPDKMPREMINFSNILLLPQLTPDGTVVGLHVSVMLLVIVFLVTHFILKYTTLGRGIYAIGGDESSTERVGFNLAKIRVFVFMLAGVIAGLAGVVGVSNIQVANPFDFQGRELGIIAAVVVGGTKITGGSGSVLGVALGVLLTNLITQNLVLIGVPPEYTRFVFGALIIFAIIVQSLQQKYKLKLIRTSTASRETFNKKEEVTNVV